MKNNIAGKISLFALCICLISALMMTVLTLSGCDSSQSDGTGESPNGGEYSITYTGKTEYLLRGPSSAGKGDEISLRAEVPMEGLLTVYLNGSLLRPLGTDEDNHIIYEFTMPSEDVTINFVVDIT